MMLENKVAVISGGGGAIGGSAARHVVAPGNVAAFVAPDLARSITSTEVDISCGAIPNSWFG